MCPEVVRAAQIAVMHKRMNPAVEFPYKRTGVCQGDIALSAVAYITNGCFCVWPVMHQPVHQSPRDIIEGNEKFD